MQLSGVPHSIHRPVAAQYVGANGIIGSIPLTHAIARPPGAGAPLPLINVPGRPTGYLVPQAGVPRAQVPQPAPPMPVKPEKLRSRALDDEELGSDDDDDDLKVDLGADDPEHKPKNSIICLFEKVTRVKNKRRVTLRDGLMKVDGKEYIFGRCTGEFDW